MYIRTPKRYRGMQRRRMFSCQRFLMMLLLVLFIVIGIGIYEMRDLVRPQMMQVIDAGMNEVDSWQSTQFAPTPTATQNPQNTLIDAGNNWDAGRITFALNSYDDVIELLPNDVPVHTRLAEGYLTRGNITDALDYADRTVTADPFNPDAWATRALVYSWEENYAEGIASAQQALALDPQNVRANAYLGYAYFQADEYNLALARAEDAIELDPDHWSGYWIRGLISENVIPVDVEAAQIDFERSYNLALTQNHAMAGVVAAGIARTYIYFGNSARGAEILNEYLTTDHSNREVLYGLGRVYTDMGEWSQAQEVLLDCVDLIPDDYSCWYLLGRNRNNLGNQEGALDAFEEAIELDTPFARHYWWAAFLQRSLGSCTGATEYLETGYDMVIEGGLPAAEEGNTILISDFEAEMATCRIAVVPPNATSTPAAESTEEVGDA